MFDSNDLADSRPFLVEIAGRSDLHSNPSVGAGALRVEEGKPGLAPCGSWVRRGEIYLRPTKI